MKSKDELKESIQLAKDNQPTLANTRRFLIEPILEIMGYSIRDVFNSFEYDYNVDGRNAINYVYKNDSDEPVIAIDAKLIHESVLIQDNHSRKYFKEIDTLKYLVIINGIESSLYSINKDKSYKYILKSNLVEEYDQIPLIFGPKKILLKTGSFWEKFQENTIKKELREKKEYFRNEINLFFTHEMNLERELTESELNRIFSYLMKNTKNTQSTKKKEKMTYQKYKEMIKRKK